MVSLISTIVIYKYLMKITMLYQEIYVLYLEYQKKKKLISQNLKEVITNADSFLDVGAGIVS